MADSGNRVEYKSSTMTVMILFFCLILLIALLFFLYKKLNRESNGEYTIRRIVYKEGGLRDQMRGAALVLGTRLGVQLWPHSDSEEHGEEMQEIQDEEVGEHSSQGSDSEEHEQEEEDSVEQKGDDASDNSSNLEGSDSEAQDSLLDQPEAKGKTGEKGEEKGGDGNGKGEASGRAGLQINLSQFSGSAIWSEEEGGEANASNVTAL